MAFRGDTIENGLLNAGADLRLNMYRCVVTSAGRWALAGANARSVGVLQNEPNTDETAEVDEAGVTMAAAGAAFLVDALLTTDATGRLVTSVGGNHIVAQAIEAASGAGSVVSVRLGYKGTA